MIGFMAGLIWVLSALSLPAGRIDHEVRILAALSGPCDFRSGSISTG